MVDRRNQNGVAAQVLRSEDISSRALSERTADRKPLNVTCTKAHSCGINGAARSEGSRGSPRLKEWIRCGEARSKTNRN